MLVRRIAKRGLVPLGREKRMKLIKMSAGNYISKDGKFTIQKSTWCGNWRLYHYGKEVLGLFRTLTQAKDEAERIELKEGRNA